MRRAALLCLVACGGKASPPPPTTTAPTAKPSEPATKPTLAPGEETTLTPSLVLEEIQAKQMAAIKRCYKQQLKVDATAKGKVQLRFTVTDTGATKDPNVSGFSADIDACIAALMPAWQFPIPLDRDGNATDHSFSITLQLIPD